MKNLIFVALLVSVMLVLTVGSAFAFEGEVDPPNNVTFSGSGEGLDGFQGEVLEPYEQEAAESSVESSDTSGGAGGPYVAPAEVLESSESARNDITFIGNID